MIGSVVSVRMQDIREQHEHTNSSLVNEHIKNVCVLLTNGEATPGHGAQVSTPEVTECVPEAMTQRRWYVPALRLQNSG